MTHDSLDGDFAKYLEGRVPLGRWGKDGELDGALIYFASDASSLPHRPDAVCGWRHGLRAIDTHWREQKESVY